MKTAQEEWQEAQSKRVAMSWSHGDKKAYWDAMLAEVRAACMMEIEKLRLENEATKSEIQWYVQRYLELNERTALMLRAVNMLMATHDTLSRAAQPAHAGQSTAPSSGLNPPASPQTTHDGE